MDRSRFETRADQLRAYARELLAAVEDCVARATNRLSGENPTGLAGASPDATGASVAPGGACRRIEDVMAAYDWLQEAIGGAGKSSNSSGPGRSPGHRFRPLGLTSRRRAHESITRTGSGERAAPGGRTEPGPGGSEDHPPGA